MMENIKFGVIFFVACLIISLFLFLISAISSRNKQKIEKVAEKKDVNAINKGFKSSPPSSNNNVGTIIVIVLFFGLCVYFYHIWRNSPRQQTSITKEHVVYHPPVQQHGILRWHKPTSMRGINPNMRKSPPMSSTIQINDDEVMSFTAKIDGGKAHFLWNKRDKCGTWYEDCSDDGGHWYLSPHEKNPKIFSGWETDKTGERLDLKLVLD